ncbi:ATPase [Weissella oryzae SG25]|uniref:ATPase n=1 Tax=Weissella oryzae (strain DSM 25784 / JCM 18191 / LMG 30913 / SG25) TaxID=1329250 RepID=A0A069CQH8_WEIOS|nr:ATP-binding protein [Weissella oryzae]GAK29920.1 ATPase [Weissella oryzae SG25]
MMVKDVEIAKLAAKPLINNAHTLVIGQTGSGKTTTVLAAIDELQATNQTNIILDPTGEYSTVPNAIVYKLAENSYFEASRLSANDFNQIFGLSENQRFISKLAQAIAALRIQKNITQQGTIYPKINVAIKKYSRQLARLGHWAYDYDLKLLAQQIIEEYVVPFADERADYQVLGQVYDYAAIREDWSDIIKLQELVNDPIIGAVFKFTATNKPGQRKVKTAIDFVVQLFAKNQSHHRSLVIDLSALKALPVLQGQLVSLLMQGLLASRTKNQERFPMMVFLDEAHRYLPVVTDKIAENGLFQILREGRKYGINLTLTTQSPLDLPVKMVTQFANLLVHQIVSRDELSYLTTIQPEQAQTITELPVGQAAVYQNNRFLEFIKIKAVK